MTDSIDDKVAQSDPRMLFVDKASIKGKDYYVQIAAVSRYTDEATLDMPMPSPVALMLSSSKKNYDDSQAFFNQLAENTKLASISAGKIQLKDDVDAIYNAIEKRIESVILAAAAVEVYCNVIIPQGAIYSRNKGESLDREKIEFLDMKEKLNKVLPQILSTKPLHATGKLWQDYLELKEARERLLHLKPLDLENTNVDDDSIWNLIARKEFINGPKIASSVIGYILNSLGESPRWFKILNL